MEIRCKHNWEKISEQVLPSPLEQIKAANAKSHSKHTEPWVFQKKYICILKCTKCPKIKKIVEVNP